MKKHYGKKEKKQQNMKKKLADVYYYSKLQFVKLRFIRGGNIYLLCNIYSK